MLDSTLSDTPGPAPLGQTWHPASVARALVTSVSSVVRGHDDVVEMVVAAVLAGGHVLIEDVPGSGKTTLARALARSLGGSFARIQGTSDLLPADVTGSAVWNPERFAFEMVAGPAVRQRGARRRAQPHLAADPVRLCWRRWTSRRSRWTVAAACCRTRSPWSRRRTRWTSTAPTRCPRASWTASPSASAWARWRRRTSGSSCRSSWRAPRSTALQPVADVADLVAARDRVRGTHVADDVLDYALAVVHGTRGDPRVAAGASTRAALMLVRLSQSLAVLRGRDFVLPDDVKQATVPCLAHRLATVAGPNVTAVDVVRDVLSRVRVPVRR